MIKKDWSAIFNNLKEKRFGILYKAILHIAMRHKPHEGINVIEEDWDNLIVLDACRFDAFEEVNTISGNLESKISAGTTTVQWLNENFTEYYEDLAYLSTVDFIGSGTGKDFNYQRKRFDADEHFHTIEKIIEDGGIEEGKHTHPKETTDRAIEFAKKHSDERKIIHYSQPHLPFVTNEVVDEEPLRFYRQYLRKGHTWEEIKQEYRNSLKLTLKEVERLVQNLEGKTVITADHGEAHGEYGVKDHPHSIYIEPLVKVPWLEVDNNENE